MLLKLENVRKEYGDFSLECSMQLQQGQITGLIGQNGAGKSTTFKATTDEVAQVAWMNRGQIKELFDADMFVETLEYFFTKVDKERS